MKSTNWKGYRIIAWVGQAILTILLSLLLLEGSVAKRKHQSSQAKK